MDNINQKYNIPMQALGQSNPGVPNPAMQGIDAESVKQSVDNSYLSNRVKASSGNDVNMGVKAATTAGAWYGITQGMDVFNKNCAGEFDKTIFGKLGRFGDKIANTAFGRFIGKGLDKCSAFYDKLAAKSKVLYALKHHNTRPEWSFAKMGSELKGFYCADLQQVLEEYVSPLSSDKVFGKVHQHSFQKLDQYHLSQSEIESFMDSLKGLSHSDVAIRLQQKELELLKVPAAEIQKALTDGGLEGLQNLAKQAKIKRLGFNLSPEQFDELIKNSFDNFDDIINALKKGMADHGDLNISIWRNAGKSGKVTSHLFGRQIALSELINKAKVIKGEAANSRLGKALAKSLGYFAEGTTCRFAGGKLVALMQAALLGDMIAHTIYAPKGEKGKTFIERFVNDFSYFIALPIGVLAMHKVGGLKYIGLDEAGVKAYRAALKAFKEKNAAGLFTKAEFSAGEKALKDMLKADVKNPIARLFKRIGSLINIGNETIPGYISKAPQNMNFFRKIPNFFRNCVGVPLRILIPLAVVSPFIAKGLTKGAHAIFGKPTHSVLDEEEENKKEEQVNDANTDVVATQDVHQQTTTVQSTNPDNLVNMYKNGNPYNNHPVQEKPKDEYTYVPSPEGVKTTDGRPEAVRSYVPSASGVQVAPEDTTSADMALARADLAEKNAMETLAMKW